MIDNSEAKILFVVSPNFGIIDSWLPILYELKKRSHRLGIVALFPRQNLLLQARDGDILTELSEILFDSVIYASPTGDWLLASSLKQGSGLECVGQKLSLVAKTALRFRKWLWPRAGSTCIRQGNALALKDLLPKVRAVLFDIDSEKLEIVRVLENEIFDKVPWFSLPHGIDLRISSPNKRQTNFTPRPNRAASITAYVASDMEISPYQISYGLEEDSIKPVGVPRHSSSWVDKLNRHFETESLPSLPYIFLASRPKNAKYFPKELKIKALQDIKRLSVELDCHIVVRCHPKEHDNDLFLEEFGQEFFGKRWTYSAKHPLVLGTKALFCITFFSSVAVDMAALGIPVIERFDFTGLTGVTQERDRCGAPTSMYQKFGLACGAQNYEELREQACRIVDDRQAAIKRVKDAYKALYRTVDDPIGMIADDIERNL